MLMSLISNLLSAYFAFLLPAFSTFKALSHRPVSEPDLERLCMYWTVMGVFVAFQYTAEWLISWFPFYFEIKTLLLLFLSIPQIQGSTFIYQSYLQPFFSKNETELDAGIQSFQNNIFVFVQTRLSGLFDIIWSLLNKTPASRQDGASGAGAQPGGPAGGAPGLSLESAMGLWKAYGPAVLGGLSRSGAASAPATPGAQAASSPPTPQPAASSTSLQPNAAPNAERRPSNSSFVGGFVGTPEAVARAPPSFPEPQVGQ